MKHHFHTKTVSLMAALLLALTITGCDDAKTPQTDDTGSSEIVTLSDA